MRPPLITIIIIIILVITFMQGIYNYIPETNRPSRVYSVAAVLYLQFALHVMLFRPWRMLCTFILALSVVCVQCPIWLLFAVPSFRAFPVRCFGIVWVILWCFQSPPIITGFTFASNFHIRWISNMRFLYFKIFSASFLITFLSIIIIIITTTNSTIIIWHYSPLRTFASLMDFSHSAVFLLLFPVFNFAFINVCLYTVLPSGFWSRHPLY